MKLIILARYEAEIQRRTYPEALDLVKKNYCRLLTLQESRDMSTSDFNDNVPFWVQDGFAARGKTIIKDSEPAFRLGVVGTTITIGEGIG